MVGAAKLERTSALQILALEKHASLGARIDRARSQHWSAVRYARESPGRRLNVGVGNRQGVFACAVRSGHEYAFGLSIADGNCANCPDFVMNDL
jgi:hypothetical protein